MKKPANYWKIFSNVRKELAPFIKKYKRLPSHRELKKAKLESLSRHGINKHGGAVKVAKLLNTITYDQSINRASQNFWTFDKTIKEIIILVKNNNFEYFPTHTQLENLNRHDLLGAIQKFKRKNFVNCKEIKVKRIRKNNKIIFETPPKDKIWNEEIIIKKMDEIVQKKGYWPSGAELDSMKLSDLRGAIQRNGGQIYFWRKLGRIRHKDRKIEDPNKYDTKQKIITKINEIKGLIGRFPSYNDLVLLEERALWIQIIKRYKNIINFYKAINEKKPAKNIFVTISGLYVKSSYEVLFDNILNFYKLKYKYEDIISNKSKKKYKYDFKLKDLNNNDVYVEIWGYNKNHKSEIANIYNQAKKEKLEIYSNNKLRLIQVDGHSQMNSSLNSVFKNISKLLIKNNIIKKMIYISSKDEINLINAKIYDENHFKNELVKVIDYYGHLPSYGKLKGKFTGFRDRVMKIGGFIYVKEKFKVN